MNKPVNIQLASCLKTQKSQLPLVFFASYSFSFWTCSYVNNQLWNYLVLSVLWVIVVSSISIHLRYLKVQYINFTYPSQNAVPPFVILIKCQRRILCFSEGLYKWPYLWFYFFDNHKSTGEVVFFEHALCFIELGYH